MSNDCTGWLVLDPVDCEVLVLEGSDVAPPAGRLPAKRHILSACHGPSAASYSLYITFVTLNVNNNTIIDTTLRASAPYAAIVYDDEVKQRSTRQICWKFWLPAVTHDTLIITANATCHTLHCVKTWCHSQDRKYIIHCCHSRNTATVNMHKKFPEVRICSYAVFEICKRTDTHTYTVIAIHHTPTWGKLIIIINDNNNEKIK